MAMVPPVLIELKAVTTEFKAKMLEARGEMQAMAEEGGGHFSKLKAVAGPAMLGIGGAAVAVGGIAIEMADKFEASHARLEAAVKASGHSMESFKAPISAVDKSMEKLGFTNAQTEEALSHAVVAIQDPTKAMKEMGLAADLARFKNVDLATATDVVDKALAGNLKGLKSMGIDLPIAATNALKLKTAQEAVAKAHDGVAAVLKKHGDAMNVGSKYHSAYEAAVLKVTTAQQKLSEAQHAGADITEALSQRLGGQATAHAETFSGKMEVLKATTEDLGKNIGLRLIPVVEGLAKTMLAAVQFIEANWPKIKAVVAVTVDWFETHVMPVFRALGEAVSAAFHVVEAVAKAVWPTIRDEIKVFVDYFSGIVRVISDLLHGHFSQAFHDALDTVKKVFGDILKFIGDTVSNLGPLILKGVAMFGTLLFDAGKALIEGLIKGIGNMAGAVVDAAKHVVGGAVDSVKHFLRISSPSQVFQELGEQTIAGFMAGVESKNAAAQAQMQAFAQGIAGTAATSMTGATSAMTSSAPASSAPKEGDTRRTSEGLWTWSIGEHDDGRDDRWALEGGSGAHMVLEDIKGTRSEWNGSSWTNSPAKMASGGIVTRPTLALIGEAGPEAVIPFRPQALGQSLGSAQGSSGGGDVIINVTGGTYIGVGGISDLARLIRDELAKTRFDRVPDSALFR